MSPSKKRTSPDVGPQGEVESSLEKNRVDFTIGYKETQGFLDEHGERLGLYRADAFCKLQLPPREEFMGKFLVGGSLTMVAAPRGLGKSLFAMGLAVALAKGEDFIGYEVPRHRSVLYLDGEMHPKELQNRLEFLGASSLPNLFTISLPHAGYPWGHLNELDDQQEVIEIIRRIKPAVVVLDNKSTLFSLKRENEAGSWEEAQQWLLLLRKMGIAVILIHHTGKNGAQRGSSMHEVILDTSIMLELAADEASSNEETKFVMRFTKARHFFGEAAKPKLVKLSTQNKRAVWDFSTPQVGHEQAQEAIELHRQGWTQRKIAAQLGVGVGTVNRWLQAIK